MKMMKWALLGGAAFAVTATSAQADELTALKAQLEALQARVTQLEAQPATSMPSGYSLLGFQDGSLASVVPESASDRIDPNSGVTISVLQAADVAPAAEISVKGEIRTFLTYTSKGFDNHNGTDNKDGSLDVKVRGRIVIDGKTDTAVGEVGAHVRFQGGEGWDGGNGDLAHMNQAYGWWKFAPSWQLIAGYWDTTAAVQAGIDWDFFAGATPGPSDKNVEQMRLVYSTGPFTAAIALEDTDPAFTAMSRLTTTTKDDGGDETEVFHPHISNADRGQFPDIAGYLMYDSGSLMLQAVGVYQDDKYGKSNDWGVGGGGHLKVGDMATLTAAVVYAKGYNGWDDNLAIGEDDKFWAASGGILFNIAENAHIEAGAGYEQVNAANFSRTVDQSVWTITGGIYWDPVSQVTVGLQANYQQFGKGADQACPDNDTGNQDRGCGNFHSTAQVRFGTWLRFP